MIFACNCCKILIHNNVRKSIFSKHQKYYLINCYSLSQDADAYTTMILQVQWEMMNGLSSLCLIRANLRRSVHQLSDPIVHEGLSCD